METKPPLTTLTGVSSSNLPCAVVSRPTISAEVSTPTRSAEASAPIMSSEVSTPTSSSEMPTPSSATSAPPPEAPSSSTPKTNLAGESECDVCSQVMPKARVHYGGVTCYSCRAFFRRLCKRPDTPCRRGNSCIITFKDRKNCIACRYAKCLKIGMDPCQVLNEDEKKVRFRKLIEKKTREDVDTIQEESHDDVAISSTHKKQTDSKTNIEESILIKLPLKKETDMNWNQHASLGNWDRMQGAKEDMEINMDLDPIIKNEFCEEVARPHARSVIRAVPGPSNSTFPRPSAPGPSNSTYPRPSAPRTEQIPFPSNTSQPRPSLEFGTFVPLMGTSAESQRFKTSNKRASGGEPVIAKEMWTGESILPRGIGPGEPRPGEPIITRAMGPEEPNISRERGPGETVISREPPNISSGMWPGKPTMTRGIQSYPGVPIFYRATAPGEPIRSMGIGPGDSIMSRGNLSYPVEPIISREVWTGEPTLSRGMRPGAPIISRSNHSYLREPIISSGMGTSGSPRRFVGGEPIMSRGEPLMPRHISSVESIVLRQLSGGGPLISRGMGLLGGGEPILATSRPYPGDELTLMKRREAALSLAAAQHKPPEPSAGSGLLMGGGLQPAIGKGQEKPGPPPRWPEVHEKSRMAWTGVPPMQPFPNFSEGRPIRSGQDYTYQHQHTPRLQERGPQSTLQSHPILGHQGHDFSTGNTNIPFVSGASQIMSVSRRAEFRSLGPPNSTDVQSFERDPDPPPLPCLEMAPPPLIHPLIVVPLTRLRGDEDEAVAAIQQNTDQPGAVVIDKPPLLHVESMKDMMERLITHHLRVYEHKKFGLYNYIDFSSYEQNTSSSDLQNTAQCRPERQSVIVMKKQKTSPGGELEQISGVRQGPSTFYSSSSDFSTTTSSSDDELRIDDKSILDIVSGLGLRTIEQTYTEEEARFLENKKNHFWQNWSQYSLGAEVMEYFKEFCRTGGEMHPLFFIISQKQFMKRIVAFLFESDEPVSLKLSTADYIQLLRCHTRKALSLFTIWNHSHDSPEQQSLFALGNADFKMWREDKVPLRSSREVLSAIPLNKSAKREIMKIMEKFNRPWMPDSEIYFLLVSIIMYNPDTEGLQNKERVGAIREEYKTMLRRYLKTMCPDLLENSLTQIYQLFRILPKFDKLLNMVEVTES